MTFYSLFMACSDMESKSSFVVATLDPENCDILTYKDWYSIPDETKAKQVMCFSFSDGDWFITLHAE